MISQGRQRFLGWEISLQAESDRFTRWVTGSTDLGSTLRSKISFLTKDRLEAKMI